MSDRTLPRLLQTPAVLLLLVWMLVPLSMTLYFSFIRYVLNSTVRPEWTTPSLSNWRGFGNYAYVLDAKDFWFAIQNSCLHRCQHPAYHRYLGPRDCGSDQQIVPGSGDRACSSDFAILCYAGCERGSCGST